MSLFDSPTGNLFEKEKNPLVIIDGYAIFFRAYYSYKETKSKDNINLNAVYGFFNTALGIIKKFKNADICVALDTGKATFRDKIFAEYKANRPETPADLKPQFAILHEALKAFELPHFFLDGYEADDIIATYTLQAVKEGRQVIIVTLDKDLSQLLEYKNVFLYDFSKYKIIGRKEVFAKFGVMPEYIVDYLALVGDACDNIPGVKSIGPKTAVELITDFGNLDNIYSNLESIKRATIKLALINHREIAFLSKSLAILHKEVDLPHINHCNFNTTNILSLNNLFNKYGLPLYS